MTRARKIALTAACCWLTTATANAQQPPSSAVEVDQQMVSGEPDYTLTALPTTLRMPQGKLDFSLTHRFTLPLDEGTAGDFFSNFFNFDGGAVVGFGLRYGLAPGLQTSVYRTSDRTIQFAGQWELASGGTSRVVTIDALGSIEGGNNFREDYSPSAGGIASLRLDDHGALYAEPIAVFNTNADPAATSGQDWTFMAGLGLRWQLGASGTYVVAETAPRLAGYTPGMMHAAFGLEHVVGGHVFQLNISRGLGTTMRQMSSGVDADHWFIGFNLTRKFW